MATQSPLQRCAFRVVGLAAAATVPVVYALLVRPRILRWGAAAEEISGDYPGDELITAPNGGGTMATTLPAPPERVWPWLVQMGRDRGGWYSWDSLDNEGVPSADQIVDKWQNLQIGQHLKGPTNV